MLGYWVVTIEGLIYINEQAEETAVGVICIGKNPLDSLFNKDGDMDIESYRSLFGYEELLPIKDCLTILFQRIYSNASLKRKLLNNTYSDCQLGVISIPLHYFPSEWLSF